MIPETAIVSPSLKAKYHEQEFDAYLERIQNRFLTLVNEGKKPLFMTDAVKLWDAYIYSFETAEERQYHRCDTCRMFITRYGALAVLDENLLLVPAFWDAEDAPEPYKPGIQAMARLVRSAKITMPFFCEEKHWGNRETSEWTHFAVTVPDAMVFRHDVDTAFQAMAKKAQNFNSVMLALREYPFPITQAGIAITQTDELFRAEKVRGPMEWLHGINEARVGKSGAAYTNAVWNAIAFAPEGFCHPRSGVLSTLLDDIKSGRSFSDVAQRFKVKLDPLTYQQAQVAPTQGAIDEAEKLIEKMGLAPSLPRRFARLDEVQALWKPPVAKEEAKAEGVFAHLKAKGAESSTPLQMPRQVITWVKFLDKVLPNAQKIEILMPLLANFGGITAPVNLDAKPVIQWDREEARNPYAWYLRRDPSPPQEFSMRPGAYYPITAVAYKPSMWGAGGVAHMGEGVFFLIEGAKDTRTPGLCLFPEILRGELHGVRSVITAYNKTVELAGHAEQGAIGILMDKPNGLNAILRVTAGNTSTDYHIDRWD